MHLEEVIMVKPGNLLSIISSYATLGISWTIFRLDNIFNSLVAFNVVRSTSFSGLNSQVTFDRVLVNEGNGWDVTNSQFVAPYDGYYVITASGGLTQSTQSSLKLMLNSVDVYSRCEIGIRTYMESGSDQLAVSAIFNLKKGDNVSVVSSFLYSSQPNFQIGFSGFYYNSKSNQQVGCEQQ